MLILYLFIKMIREGGKKMEISLRVGVEEFGISWGSGYKQRDEHLVSYQATWWKTKNMNLFLE